MAGDPAPGGALPPEGQPTSAASLSQRIGARLLDALLIGIPASLILNQVGVGGIGSGVVLSLLWFGYFVFLESSQGATVGKKLLKLRVAGLDGANPPPEVAAKRNVWMLAGLIPLVGGFLSLIAVIVIIVTISQNTENRGLHDTFAGAVVVR